MAVAMESKDDIPPALCTVRAMLRDGFHQPAKHLECLSLLSDVLRHQLGYECCSSTAACHHPVCGLAQVVSTVDWASVCLNPELQGMFSGFVCQNIPATNGDCVTQIQGLDRTKSYVWKSNSHPGFESMYFCEDKDKNSIMVLHQKNIKIMTCVVLSLV
jgi:hypothetical protein